MQPGAGIAHELRQLLFSGLDRHRPQVLAVELQQVEREQHRLGLDPAAVAQPLEHRKPALVTHRDLAVDQARPDLKGADGVEHRGIARAPVITVSREQPAADIVALCQQAVAIVLDLMNPARPLRRPDGDGRKAGLDESDGRLAVTRT